MWAQYKNYKNFLNLCYHYEDFGLESECFFATSHGKSACDGIGGTVKRTTAKASLQRSTENQIISVQAMYDFCVERIHSNKFILITEESMVAVRTFLSIRFALGHTVPGTRTYHHYRPVLKTTVAYKHTSEDTEFQNFNLITGVVETLHNQTPIESLKQYSFVSCKYDSFWWIGMIQEIYIC